jgi:hypothetical protein
MGPLPVLDLSGRQIQKSSKGTSVAGSHLPCMQKDQGIVKDGRGQDQPKDKKRAQQSGLKKRAQQPGLKEQREAAENQPQSPGEPAKGE